jgi:hypothetical protein
LELLCKFVGIFHSYVPVHYFETVRPHEAPTPQLKNTKRKEEEAWTPEQNNIGN